MTNMKQVYIVSNHQWLFGVHKTKAGAKDTKKQAVAEGECGVVIKKRYDTLWYMNIKD